MTNYSRGVDLERELIKIFKENGWDSVRGAGSKGKVIGFDIDLIFSKKRIKNEDEVHIVLLQAKRMRKKKSNAR